MQYIDFDYYTNNLHSEKISYGPLVEGLLYGLTLGVKSCIMIFIFI